MAADEECVATPDEDSSKRSKRDVLCHCVSRENRKTAETGLCPCFGHRRAATGKLPQSGSKIAATAAFVPNNAAAQTEPSAEEPQSIAGDPTAVKDITEFYQTWIVKRNAAQASGFASKRSYQCLPTPSKDQKELKPIARIQSGLEQPLTRIPSGTNLSDMMSSVQPVNDLLRPVQQANSKAFAMMAVPDQKADSFLCQNRHLPEKTPDLKPADAKYGAYYLTASRLNYGEEQSPALLLLWTKEEAGWKVVAWAVELP